MPGLTSAGLEIATLADLIASMRAAWSAAFGASMDTSDRSPDGQLLGVTGEPLALLWELLEAVVASQDPAKATKAALDAICALSGTVRVPASFSAVTLTLTGTPTTSVPNGSLVATESTGQQFATTADFPGLIVALTAWAGLTAYATGDRRANASNAYVAITPGVSAGSGGPVLTTPDEVDGTVHWRWLGAGTGVVDVTAKATVSGPVVAVSGDLTRIDSPVGGWSGVTNLLDASVGRVAMTDAELRALREQELARPGTSPADAIAVALLDTDKDTGDPVTSVTVFVNNDDVVDADGLGPHSIEPMVRGGSDQAIWNALRDNVAAGIRTQGTENGTAVDRTGVAQPFAFSRVSEVLVWVVITLRKDPGTYPSDGDAQVALAVATWGNSRPDGLDVVASKIIARVDTVLGVIDIDLPFIGTAPAPGTSTTIVMTRRQRAVFDTSRITVTSSDGTT